MDMVLTKGELEFVTLAFAREWSRVFAGVWRYQSRLIDIAWITGSL